MTILSTPTPLAIPTAGGTETGPGALRRLEDRLHRCGAALAACPWRATLRFVAAVAGVLALISAAPEIAAALGRFTHWAMGDAAAAIERAVLAMAQAAHAAP